MKFLLLSLFFSMRLEIRGSDVLIELGRAGETKIGEAEYAYTLVNFNINARQFQH